MHIFRIMTEHTAIERVLVTPRQGNRTTAVYETLLDNIIDGTIAGGTIVEERALVDLLDVSRTPLREALGRLQGEGFLIRQGRKLVVHHISERNFIEILHLRRILESEAVALATSRISPDATVQLWAALRSLKNSDASFERHWAVDDLLHRTIAEASGNSRLYSTIMDLRRKTKSISMRLMMERNYPALDFNEHMAILTAIEQADPEEARKAMVAHIDSARDNILRKIGEF
jgi:DNA-binding GntR family transcriptional regulator